jgi:hypothetical protein
MVKRKTKIILASLIIGFLWGCLIFSVSFSRDYDWNNLFDICEASLFCKIKYFILFLPVNLAFILFRIPFCDYLYANHQECAFFPMVLAYYLSPLGGALIAFALSLIVLKILKN